MNAQVKQTLDGFLQGLDVETRTIYHEIIAYLEDCGYKPKKEKSQISFKHSLHNKQIAKLGLRKGPPARPFFALRFSACAEYSQRFADIVRHNIAKYPSKAPGCLAGKCSFCAGEPDTHVYKHTFPGGEHKAHCGAYALEIPDITAGDVDEIKGLIAQEHAYLIKHQVG